MSLIATLTNPTANKIYALGDGRGSVCDFGTVDILGCKLSIRDGLFVLNKVGQFTALKCQDGDPLLVTAGTCILPGVYTMKRLDDDNCFLIEDVKPNLPLQSLVTIDMGAGLEPTDNDTVTFTPPTWFGSPVVYRFKTGLAAANDLQITLDSPITNMRRIQRAIIQSTPPPTDYFAGTVGLGHVWPQAPLAVGQVGTMLLQNRMAAPSVGVPNQEWGFVTGSITGGSVQQGGWYKVDIGQVNAIVGSLADVQIRMPTFLGNRGNKRGRGRLLGALAIASGAAFPGDAKLLAWGAGYISDSQGTSAIIPRADYFNGWGNVAPIPIVLPVGTFVPFGNDGEGVLIEKAGFLFTITGTAVTAVQLHFLEG